MIDVWLKIRDRGNLDRVLSNLNFWLGIFSDKNYDIYIYSENLKLPRFYNFYKIRNKVDLSQNHECKKILNSIMQSSVSNNWKSTAFALSAPYFYLYGTKSEYVYNIDADDIIMLGNTSDNLKELERIIKDEQITTISYDYIFSDNIYDKRNSMPQHWTFGINLSNKFKMAALCSTVINKSKDILSNINGLLRHEVNLDILFSQYLKTNNINKYDSFITSGGMVHSNDNFEHITKYKNGLIHIDTLNERK